MDPLGFSTILELVALPSSRRSSQPREQTYISCGSCIAGRFFTAEPLGKPCTYIYMCIFLVRLFSIIDHYEILNIVPCVIQQSRSLLFIYFIYSLVYMLIPSSKFIPYPVSPSKNLQSLVVKMNSYCLFNTFYA